MLEGLDTIQWNTLNHAYGSAEDIPDLIRSLTHADDDIRDKTLYALYSNIWHQGTVYEATVYAIPFLIELLASDEVTRKYDILIYLAHLAQSTSYFEVDDEVVVGHSAVHQLRLKQCLIQEKNLVEQIHREVYEGIEVYFRLLYDETEELHTRMAVPYLLACFPECQTTIAPRLKSLLPYETHRLMRASLVLALRYLHHEDNDTTYLEPYLAPDEDLIVRVCSAITIAHIATYQTPLRVIDLLVAILKNSSAVDEEYEQLTWSEGDIVGDIGKALMHVGYSKLEPVMPDLIKMLRRVDFYSALTYVDALMYILFEGVPFEDNKTIDDLTPYQCQALQTIVESYSIWRIKLNDGKTMLNGNISQLMKAYHLPTTPDAMLDFLRR